MNADTQKGRHTTTTARLIPLQAGGYVVDTPGHSPVSSCGTSFRPKWQACFRDLRPYITHCRFPNCTHTHETDCAVKNAVADGRIDARRYESYCILFVARCRMSEPERGGIGLIRGTGFLARRSVMGWEAHPTRLNPKSPT